MNKKTKTRLPNPEKPESAGPFPVYLDSDLYLQVATIAGLSGYDLNTVIGVLLAKVLNEPMGSEKEPRRKPFKRTERK